MYTLLVIQGKHGKVKLHMCMHIG